MALYIAWTPCCSSAYICCMYDTKYMLRTRSWLLTLKLSLNVDHPVSLRYPSYPMLAHVLLRQSGHGLLK